MSLLDLIPGGKGVLAALSVFCGALVAGAAVYALVASYDALVAIPAAEKRGRDQAIAERAIEDAAAELKRKGDDAMLQSLSDYDLCVAGLRDSFMPVDACEQLRGVREEQSVAGGNGGADQGRSSGL